jgi:hypothetical protein
MKTSAIYSNIAKSVAKSTAIAALAVTALAGATTAQARPHYIQDVQYVQVAPQLVITPPQLVVQAPVYVHPRHARPVYVQPVVVQQPVQYAPRFVPGRIYYINGRPFLNGHPYRGYGKVRHHERHGHHGDGHGHGHGHGGGHR